MSGTSEHNNYVEGEKVSLPMASLSAISYYVQPSELLDDNYHFDAVMNGSAMSSTLNGTYVFMNDTAMSNTTVHQLINNVLVQSGFFILYTAIFVIGIFGNVLVCYVVIRNRAMHTVTNYFITNLALSDVLLCVLAVPFTPLYTFLGRWVFGRFLCHLVSYAQGCSVYISTLTLTAIAMDRFFVIIYPFHPRMKVETCVYIIAAVWVCSLLLTLPYGLYMSLNTYDNIDDHYCEEDWPSESSRKLYGSVTVALQFILPFLIIAVCYICVSVKLSDRNKAKPGNKTMRREESDRQRKKRTNAMLMAMVAVFGISWLPLNSCNIFNDFYETKSDIYTLLFFVAHCIAMSSTCYNPFLYAWLNDNFRKEFKQVLPCFENVACLNNNGVNGNSRMVRGERTFCNGDMEFDQEIGQESLLQTKSTRASDITPREPTYTFHNSHNSCKADIEDGIMMTTMKVPIKKMRPLTTVLNSGVLETPFDEITSYDDLK